MTVIGDHPVQAPKQHPPPATTPHAAGSDGTLFLVGGGNLPESGHRRFLELAGGKEVHLVVIPSASARPNAAARPYARWQTAEVGSLRVLYTNRLNQAGDARLYALPRDATGVWIAGGDQSRLTALYGATPVERELAGVLRRGAVVGGTPAGAAVVSGVMVDRGKAAKGIGLLTCCIVDQHFSNWHRVARLVALLHGYPSLAGISMGEETAVVIRGAQVSVLGNATVTLATADPRRPVARIYRASSHFRRAGGVQPPAPSAQVDFDPTARVSYHASVMSAFTYRVERLGCASNASFSMSGYGPCPYSAGAIRDLLLTRGEVPATCPCKDRQPPAVPLDEEFARRSEASLLGRAEP
jgi:cyanophycinase